MNIKKFKKNTRQQLTQNFNSIEFQCKCSKCDHFLVDLDHVGHLQLLRDKLNSPITITSAYRCDLHNKEVGGSENSQHKLGTATDIQVKGMTPDKVQESCTNFDGLGRYDTFTHIDSRGYKARWDFRSKKEVNDEYLPNGPTEEEINHKLKEVEDNLSKSQMDD